jgi:hypothetical protein
MAEEVKARRVRVRVLCHYGRHVRGDIIEVDEREYRRVGKRVLLSKEDEEAQRREAELRRAQDEARLERDRSSATGWAEKEQLALRVVRQRFLEEQRKQREILVGEESADKTTAKK